MLRSAFITAALEADVAQWDPHSTVQSGLRVGATVGVGDHASDAAILVERHHIDRRERLPLAVAFDVEAEQKGSAGADHTRRPNALQPNRTGDVAVEVSNR